MPADRFMSFLREGGADAESGIESPLSCGAFFGGNEESSKTEAGEKILAINACMIFLLVLQVILSWQCVDNSGIQGLNIQIKIQ